MIPLRECYSDLSENALNHFFMMLELNLNNIIKIGLAYK